MSNRWITGIVAGIVALSVEVRAESFSIHQMKVAIQLKNGTLEKRNPVTANLRCKIEGESELSSEWKNLALDVVKDPSATDEQKADGTELRNFLIGVPSTAKADGREKMKNEDENTLDLKGIAGKVTACYFNLRIRAAAQSSTDRPERTFFVAFVPESELKVVDEAELTRAPLVGKQPLSKALETSNPEKAKKLSDEIAAWISETTFTVTESLTIESKRAE